MKNILKIKLWCSIVLSILTVNVFAQAIVVNNTPVVGTCSLGGYGNGSISVPTEALSGDNILLNITFPATSVGCVKKVTITNSTNLNFVSSVTSFVPAGPNVYTNAAVLDPINGQNFNVIYKFPNGVTCNNATGTFSVEFEVTCGATVTKCTATVSVKARAANYWTVSKQYVTGNLVCGQSKWYLLLTHSNPNPYGLGAYNISGTITETTPLPIISGATTSVSGSCYASGSYIYTVILKNCQNAGTTITNTANYNLTLGSGCGTMTGTVSAVSATLAAPNASISFTKQAYSSSGFFFNGCNAYYVIGICNNGNVPWTNFTVTDNLTIPGINVTSISLQPGWSQSPGGLTGVQTFTNSTLVLNPGDCAYIYIYFTVTGAVASTVTNTATLSYAGYAPGGGGGGGSGCPSITCPTIDTAIKNTTASTTFTISAPKSVPTIVKCNEPNPWVVPIKQVGNTIKFRIQVGNIGSAPYSGTVTDPMGSPQDLTIIPGSITYTYFQNQSWNYCGGLSGAGCVLPCGLAPSLSVTWNSNVTNPVFNINNLPGNCNLSQTNIVVIEFDATINPQISGSKTNTATMGTQTASANYTIDKTGEIKIRKTASVSTVENGGTFFYTLTVTNMGSTPLNNIVVTDNLPSCVQLNGPIVVKLGVGGPIVSNTVSGTVVITVNPAAVINPGQSFVITVPVKKISGTNCCNPLATATGKMVPDGTLINATTPIDQPACVTSTTCCDINNVEVSLTNLPGPKPNAFNLFINAGPVPVQEVEISMLDYHVEYSSTECKPANMGMFGNIYSANPLIGGGLAINNNGTHSIDWGLGNPAVINQNIRLSISSPSILALCCCKGTMYFCIKVRIKNVNCQVCEKIVCGKYLLKPNISANPCNSNPVNPDIHDVIDVKNKQAYSTFMLRQEQAQETESMQIQNAVEGELKKLDPKQAQELLQKIGKNPKDASQLLKGTPPLAAPTGGTTPVPIKK